MDLETYIKNAVAASRKERLDNSDQLTLGELILKLEAVKQEHKDKGITVCFDFGTAVPTTLCSWRGSYDELALGYSLTGYDNDKHRNDVNVDDLLNELKSALGKEFTGWKGGDFRMSKNTPVWVANPGNAGHTAIIEVVDADYQCILITGYREY